MNSLRIQDETRDLYAALAAGDPDTVRRFAPRMASLAAAARKARALAPHVAAATLAAAIRAPALKSTSAAPFKGADEPLRPSRSAHAAYVHGDPINASRKRAGLAPLTADELAQEFAGVDRVPPRRTLRRADANIVARRQGLPADQAGIDQVWAGIAAKQKNAPPPARREPTGRAAHGARPARTQAVDWSAIVERLNRHG
jgi:hypothetical protein